MRMKKHTTVVSPVLILFLTCLVICHAEEADIEMVYVRVNAFNEIIPLDQQSGLIPVVNFRNNGPDDIRAANGSDLNFNIKAYLSSDPDKREAEATFALNLGYLQGDSLIVTDLQKPVLSQAVRGFTLDGVEIVIPSDACEQVDYFCVEVVLVNEGFTDPDLNNNVYCARFALPLNYDNIGIFKCYIDIDTTHAVVSAPNDVTYLVGDANNITFNATIINTGGITLNRRHGGDFALYPTVYLTDSAQLESASVKERQDDISIRYTDDVAPDTPMTLEAFVSSITLPTDNEKCSKIAHVCLDIQDSTGNYTDFDITNNDYCLQFGAVSDGKAGFKYGCPVNGIDLRIETFEVVDWQNTVYNIGVDNTITLDALIANLGDDPILDSTGPDNYDFNIYLSNHPLDVGEATVTVDCTMDLALTTNLKQGLIYGDTLTSKGIVATCKLPADTEMCKAYQSLCLEIVKGANAPYAETVTDNNIVCVLFGDKIGNKSCPDLDIDLQIQTFEIVDWQNTVYNIGVDNTVTVDALIANLGDDPILDSAGPDNYDFKIYLSNHPHDLGQATETVVCMMNLALTTNLQLGLIYGDTLTTNGIAATCKLPADTMMCKAYQSLCLEIAKGTNAPYTETVTDNNIVCELFGDKIGNKSCPDLDIDITPTEMAVSPSQQPYPLDTTIPANVTIRVTNAGPGDLPEVEEPSNNFNVTVWLSNKDHTYTDGIRVVLPATPANVTHLRQGLNKDEIIEIILSPANINIPEDSCQELLYLCVTVSLDESSIYKEVDSGSDDLCEEFGSLPNKAGETECIIATTVAATKGSVSEGCRSVKDVGLLMSFALTFLVMEMQNLPK